MARALRSFSSLPPLSLTDPLGLTDPVGPYPRT